MSNIIINIFIVILIFLLLGSCEKETVNNTIVENKWIEDIEFFKTELPKNHINLFHNIDENEFNSDIKELKDKINSLSDNDIIIELMKIMAKIGDSHTTLVPPSYFLSYKIPIDFYLFDDGLYPISCISDYQNILGKKVLYIYIENIPIDTIFSKISNIIPHENQYWLRSEIPKYLNRINILHSLKLISSVNKISIEFEDIGHIEIEIFPEDDLIDQQYVSIFDNISRPVYLQNTHLNYWFTFLNDSNILYIQQNKCLDMTSLSFSSLCDSAFSILDRKLIDKVIYDVRHNSGGSSDVGSAIISHIRTRDHLNKVGKFFICIGRKTFSSTLHNICNIRGGTNGLFVGEPTGGKPNHYGAYQSFTLPNSKIKINYSTLYFGLIQEDIESFSPDIYVDNSSNYYFSGIDPVLNRIIEY